MVTNITKGIKTDFLPKLCDLVPKALLTFVTLFVKHNCSCKFNPDCVAMFLNI